MTGDDAGGALVESALGEAVACVRRAAWGFTNRTDIVTLVGGERVVLQRYRRRDDSVRRVPVTGAGRPGYTRGATGSPAAAHASNPPITSVAARTPRRR